MILLRNYPHSTSITGILILMILHPGITSSTSFTNINGCICPHEIIHNFTYECTTFGIGATLWRGTAFNCAGQGNEITLRHNLFTQDRGATDFCNSGNITGYSLRAHNNIYTSRIVVLFSSNLIGRSVECIYDSGSTEEVIGSFIIHTETGSFPPPMSVSLAKIQPGPELTFNWTEVTTNCQTTEYSITSDCGNCPIITTFNMVVCTNVHIDDNRMCSFAVKTKVCGSIEGIQSNNLSVMLKGHIDHHYLVPDSPNPNVVPVYSQVTGQLIRLNTEFIKAIPFNITDRIDGSATSYTITYTDAISGNICTSNTIFSSSESCMTGICKHYYDARQSSSTCTNSVLINVTVSATNLLGSGPISTPFSVLDVNNSFVKVTVDPIPPTITCTFLNQQGSSTKTCSVVYAFSEVCVIDDTLLLAQKKQTAQSVSNTVTVGLPISRTSNNHSGCFIATATNSTFTAMVQGSFNTGCDPYHLNDGVSLSNHNFTCDPPLMSLAIKDGLICYDGTHIGAIAIHYCHNCNNLLQSTPVRVCLANGTWNGTTFQCKCNTGTVSNSDPSLQLLLGLLVPVVALLVSLIVALIVTTVYLIREKKRVVAQFQNKVVEMSVIYEDIADSKPESDTEKNVAYNTTPLQ